jgi:hypothetical protein
MSIIRPSPERTRRSLILGFGAVIGGAVFLWRWRDQEPSTLDKLVRLMTGQNVLDETPSNDGFAPR